MNGKRQKSGRRPLMGVDGVRHPSAATRLPMVAAHFRSFAFRRRAGGKEDAPVRLPAAGSFTGISWAACAHAADHKTKRMS
ncbi:MAG: hypothetical protein D6757_09610 [Alphaproteobacteria bacterium]|nr:MAG: hypothetical protein D6757_09610 [Alphaproteobacteria bacterium]